MLLKSFGNQILAATVGIMLSAGIASAQISPKSQANGPPARGSAASDKKKNKPTQGATFRLAGSYEGPGRFDFIITDGEESVISGSYTVDQVKSFRDVMAEARAFALTDEGVGNGEPQTTRFFDEENDALIIDVMKFESRSQLFITYETQSGRITVEGGTLDRREKKEAGFFYDLLAKVELELKKQAPPSK
ncbi:MAG TPA: hypothetical protein VNH22_14790 [Blastocatellia bacterium]|jgi:hypothetical protein|nr:hypothetical protein [Blastocatellia bacterium]